MAAKTGSECWENYLKTRAATRFIDCLKDCHARYSFKPKFPKDPNALKVLQLEVEEDYKNCRRNVNVHRLRQTPEPFHSPPTADNSWKPKNPGWSKRKCQKEAEVNDGKTTVTPETGMLFALPQLPHANAHVPSWLRHVPARLGSASRAARKLGLELEGRLAPLARVE
ncbi:MAG: hypothetical protein M1826_003193 [Phylliscum demangeonii]|nr:MAG: hypothetical protein M1826_003193 [Phylliscum demangeonii]